jgi:hypothetical protein
VSVPFRSRHLVAVLAVALSMVGCGGGGDDGLSAVDKIDLLCAQDESVAMCQSPVSEIEAEKLLERLRLENQPDSFFEE